MSFQELESQVNQRYSYKLSEKSRHAHHPEERMQEPLPLTKPQVEQKTERQCRLDGDVEVLSLPCPSADARGAPKWRSPPVTSTE